MATVSRRGAIGVGIAGLAGLGARGTRAEEAPPSLRAVVTLGGKVYEYLESEGRDLGDFVAVIGNFTQRCVQCEVSGLPLTVFFRPDRGSDRVEVVFELGRIFSAAPANLGAYTVAIYRGAQLLTKIEVAAHYWFSRWRWQSNPRPVVADIDRLIRDNLLPPYSRVGAPASAPAAEREKAPALSVMPLPNGDYLDVDVLAQFAAGNYANAAKLVVSAQQYALLNVGAATADAAAAPAPTSVVTASASLYAVMGLAGVTAYMPMTGERNDIGLVTEPQGAYICTNDQAALDMLRAQAEAAGTMPWHMRDETQTHPFDFRRYPNATWYYSTRAGTPHIKVASTPVTVDSAHQPALAYLPYLLTGDPYHLEDLQFQATYNWGALPAAYRPSIPQPRTFAWSLRTLAQAAKVTPISTPSWLLPRSYWFEQLAVTREWFEDEFVHSILPERLIFRTTSNINEARDEPNAPAGTWVSPWQGEFLASVLGWMVTMGFTEWRMAFDWTIGGTIARTGTWSGWPRAVATPYRLVLRASKNAPIAGSWSEAWELAQSVNQQKIADRDTWALNDLTYLVYTRGALVYAAKLGVSGAAENLAWATAQIKKRGWKTAQKWRLGEGL